MGEHRREVARHRPGVVLRESNLTSIETKTWAYLGDRTFGLFDADRTFSYLDDHSHGYHIKSQSHAKKPPKR